MAIAMIDDEESNEVGTTDVPPTRTFVSAEDMKTSTLFSSDVELDNIIQDVKGLKWTVDYFLQLRNVNDTVSPPDVNIPQTVQKYHRIRKLNITLQTPIEQGNVDDITGSAIINSGFLPNQSDVFLATLTGGREALFIITNIDIKHYNIHQIYSVDFKLFKFVEGDSTPSYNDILLKVTKEYVYDNEHLLDYSAPIILATDYTAKLNLKKKLPELYDHYLRYFVEPQFSVISPPTEVSVYVDPYLTSFFFKIMSVVDHEKMMKLTRIDIDNGSVYTLWDMLIRRDIAMLPKINRNIGFKYTPSTAAYATLRAACYLGINFIATPHDNSNDIIVPTYKDIACSKTDKFVEPITGKLASDKSYIFSEAFYNDTLTTKSPMEDLVIAYLKEEILNIDSLNVLLRDYQAWKTEEQFYLIPILIVLVKDAISKAYKSI